MNLDYFVTYTDTFAGEANYSWVRRCEVSMPDESRYAHRRYYRGELMRKVKRVLGLTGVRGRLESYGEQIAFRPAHSCTVVFIVLR